MNSLFGFESDAVQRCERWDDMDLSARERNRKDIEEAAKERHGDFNPEIFYMEPEQDLTF